MTNSNDTHTHIYQQQQRKTNRIPIVQNIYIYHKSKKGKKILD